MFQTMAEVREENSYYPQLLWKGLELGLKTVRSSTPRTRIHGDKTWDEDVSGSSWHVNAANRNIYKVWYYHYYLRKRSWKHHTFLVLFLKSWFSNSSLSSLTLNSTKANVIKENQTYISHILTDSSLVYGFVKSWKLHTRLAVCSQISWVNFGRFLTLLKWKLVWISP